MICSSDQDQIIVPLINSKIMADAISADFSCLRRGRKVPKNLFFSFFFAYICTCIRVIHSIFKIFSRKMKEF